MLRYDRQTKPGLVALYDIRPGNGEGPFLQPRNPHGAVCGRDFHEDGTQRWEACLQNSVLINSWSSLL